MNPHLYSANRSTRVACGIALVTVAALSGCNLPSSSSEATQTPGDYASAQQSLQQPSNVNPGASLRPAMCPVEGVVDFYDLYFNHEIHFKLSEDMGFTMTPHPGSHHVLLAVASDRVYVVGATDHVHTIVGFDINGTWDYPNVKCTLSGQTLLKVSVYGQGEPPCRNEDELFLTVFESWEKAPIHAECECKRPSGSCNSQPLDVTIPVLGDRGTDLVFIPINSVFRQEGSAGPFTALFVYEVKRDTGFDSELDTEVPLVPLTR